MGLLSKTGHTGLSQQKRDVSFPSVLVPPSLKNLQMGILVVAVTSWKPEAQSLIWVLGRLQGAWTVHGTPNLTIGNKA